MWRFEYINVLYALLGVPVLILLFWWLARKRKQVMEQMGEVDLVKQLVPERALWRVRLKSTLFVVAYVFLVVAIANPQLGSSIQEVKTKGAEIIIALDVSNSMLAEDISPNRLEKAKREIALLINELKTDRLGLIIFAGRAYTQLPLTTDYAAAKMFLKTIRPGIVPTQGTAIGEAIELGMRSFSSDESQNKAIILITDGENHEDDAAELAKQAKEKGIIVHTIGMGSVKGVPIPFYRNGRKDFRKDREGNVVVTQLNEQMLKDIAGEGNGLYVHAGNSSTGLKMLYDRLDRMEKGEFEKREFSDYDDYFQFFLAVALFLLLVDLIILPVKRERKISWLGFLNASK